MCENLLDEDANADCLDVTNIQSGLDLFDVPS